MKEINKKNLSIQMVWSYFGKISTLLLSYVVSVVLARLLSPNDYGIVSVANIFVSIFNTLIAGGFDSALIYKKDVEEIDYYSVFSLTLIISVILYLIIFFIAPYISYLYHDVIIKSVLRVLGITLILNSIQTIFIAKFIKKIDFKTTSIISFISSFISAIIGIVLAFKNYGPWALVTNQLLFPIIRLFLFLIVTRTKLLFTINIKRIIPLFNYGWKIFLTTIIGTLYENITPLIIGIKFSKNDLAFYDKGRNTAYFASSTFVSSISETLFPALCSVQDDKTKIKYLTKKYIKTVTYIIYPLLLGFFVVAKSYIEIILTEKWLPVLFYLRSFCIANLFALFIGANINASKSIGKSELVLKGEIIKKICYSIIIMISLAFGKSPKSLAISMILVTFIEALINANYNKREINYGFLMQLYDAVPNLVISIIMAILVYFIGFIFNNQILSFFVQIISGIVIYLLLSVIEKNENFYFLLDFLKEYNRNKK